MLNLAVLGCGPISAMHARNIARHEKARLCAVYDIHQPAAMATDTHADLIEAAARAGKAILCEKPLDIDIDRVTRCAEVIAGLDVPFQIGFNRRFDPSHRAARAAVKAGEIGDLHQMIITSRDPEIPPRAYLEAAGDLLRDMTIHDFDLARFMLDDEPEKVFAIAGALIDPRLGAELNEVDTTMIIHDHPALPGRKDVPHQRLAHGSVRLRPTGRAARPSQHDPVRQSQAARDAPLRRRSHGGIDALSLLLHCERYQESFNAEIDAFVEAVQTGRSPEAGFEDGR